MRPETVRRIIAGYGPYRGSVVCDTVPVAARAATEAFQRAEGFRVVEALLDRAGLLTAPGYWLLRPAAAAPKATEGVVVREASATGVRLILRPGGAETAIVCHLLVYRDKGTPQDVQRALRQTLDRLRVVERPAGPHDPAGEVVSPMARPESRETQPPAVSPPQPPPQPVCQDAAVNRIVNCVYQLELLIDAVDGTRLTRRPEEFVRAIALEFCPHPNFKLWKNTLDALAQWGWLEFRRDSEGRVGYVVTPASRRRLDLLRPPPVVRANRGGRQEN